MTAERSNVTRIAFIGFGEVGQRFALDLSKVANVALSAFDIAFDTAAGRDSILARTEKLSVAVAASASAACNCAHIVVSAVTADQTEAVAKAAAAFLKPGQIYFDVNSASPETKACAAIWVNASGAHYVEAAVMAAVKQPGIRVPILAGGPDAERVAGDLNRLGMNVTPVATVYGRASAIKLCRSIVIKGLEALMVDCSGAAKAFGVESEVYASLSGTYPSIDWAQLADNMGERVATHGIRRSAEMREAADMLAEKGIDPSLAAAVADAQARGAKS